ncbi:MAG TPA: threonine/serine exporter family protein [Aggregatilineales bacterium]|nr:threonine/serine exporter family protein [Anaerolineales bacterium]HRE46181.1 threonine/serine exporter family protein [Aggregatilineales bacterium]
MPATQPDTKSAITAPAATQPPLNAQELAEVLRVSMCFGLLMLGNGASSHRTEQTMRRVAEIMGAAAIEPYVTPTGIIASIYSGENHRTMIRRVLTLAVDMNKVAALESLSRNMPPNPTTTAISAKLDAIEALTHQFSRRQIILAVALACGAFAILIGGGAFEFIAAAAGAAVAQRGRFWMASLHFTPIPTTIVCAALATLVAQIVIDLLIPLAPAFGVTVVPAFAVIASVLLLVPGVPLVTAVLDLTYFDLVSGIVRATWAALLFGSIAIGMLTILVWTGLRII